MFLPVQLSCRTRERLYRATAGLALAIWLTMAFAEICPPFHAWLHGGSVPDDDDCAVVAIALGHFDSATPEVPPVMPVHWIQIEPRIEFSVFVAADKNLPQGRAPPFLSAES
jgi:hypothetical protein